MGSLKDKIVFVTGASSGIGESCARAFAAAGAKLILAARRTGRLEKLSGELETAHGTQSRIVALDVRDGAAVAAAVGGLPEAWAEIDVLVNNAGLSRGLDKLHEGKIEDWDEMIDTNVKGLLYVSRAVLPGMVARGRGHVINIGSIAGHEVYPGGNVYCATKFAVDALSKGHAARPQRDGRPGHRPGPRHGRDGIQPGPLSRGRGEGGQGLCRGDAPDSRRYRRRRALVRHPAAPCRHRRDARHAHGPGVDDGYSQEIGIEIKENPMKEYDARSLFVAVLFAAVAGLAASAQKTAKIDLSGTWTGSAMINGGASKEDFTLIFEKKGEAYTGKITTATGMAQDAELRNIVLTGDKLSLEFDLNGDVSGDVITVEVTVTADAMTGTWSSSSGQGDTIEAKKQK